MGVVEGQRSDGHVYYMDCIPVIVENAINTWLAVLSVCLCYQRLLENMHEVNKMLTSKEGELNTFPVAPNMKIIHVKQRMASHIREEIKSNHMSSGPG